MPREHSAMVGRFGMDDGLFSVTGEIAHKAGGLAIVGG